MLNDIENMTLKHCRSAGAYLPFLSYGVEVLMHAANIVK